MSLLSPGPKKISRRSRALMSFPGNVMALVFMVFMAKSMLGGLMGNTGRAAPEMPPLSGRVVDAAHILAPETITRLETMSAALEAKTQAQFVVATIEDLKGRTIEEYGYKLGRAWAIGRKDIDDGVLLLVAPKERAVRIEVGYGLEGTLTDALSSSIINREILPAFREGNWDKGVLDGAGRIIAIAETSETAKPANKTLRALDEKLAGLGSDVIIAAIFMLVFSLIPFLGLIELLRVLLSPAYGAQLVDVATRSSGWNGGGGGGGSSGGGSRFSGGGGSFGGGGASGRW